MPFKEAVIAALVSLRSNKLRSFLTLLGIFIGVAAVVSVVAITSGLDRYISEQVLDLGTKSFSIQKFDAVITSHERFLEMARRRDLTLTDVEFVRRRCDACLEVGASVETNRTAKWRDVKQEGVAVLGVTDNYNRIGSARPLSAGRYLVPDDVERAQPAAVIGADLAEAFFPLMEPLGKTILVGGRPLRIVGVAEKKGSLFGFSQDNFAWIPITTFRKYYSARDSVTIQVAAVSMEQLETAQDQCRVALRARRHLDYREPDDFSIETGETIMDLWQTATRNIYVVTIVVTIISLVVGGIVVMNIMLVSVTERTREIGVRKAIGARRRDIRRQFLVESVVLSVVGGGLGVVGATVFSMLLASILGGVMKTPFSAPIQLWAIVLALVMSTAVGLVAGIYPASHAAALAPVEALRYE
ncbi:MAG: ABC transporter permease [Vicinamibacteria bacterium]|nr:ABC transporter permease [Vicinamibacteria bacterium]